MLLVSVLETHQTRYLFEQFMPSESDKLSTMLWDTMMFTENITLMQAATRIREMKRPITRTCRYFNVFVHHRPLNVPVLRFILEHTLPPADRMERNHVSLDIPCTELYQNPSYRNKEMAELMFEYRHLWRSKDRIQSVAWIAVGLHGEEWFAKQVIAEVSNVDLRFIAPSVHTVEFMKQLRQKGVFHNRDLMTQIVKHAIETTNFDLILDGIQCSEIRHAIMDQKTSRQWFARELLSKPFTNQRVIMIEHIVQCLRIHGLYFRHVLRVVDSPVLRGQIYQLQRNEHRPYHSKQRKTHGIRRRGVLSLVIDLNVNAHVSFDALGKMINSSPPLKEWLRGIQGKIYREGDADKVQMYNTLVSLIAIPSTFTSHSRCCLIS